MPRIEDAVNSPEVLGFPEPTIADALQALRESEAADLQHMDVRPQADEPNDEVAPLYEPADLSFEATPPAEPTRRMVNATWRILEEQRVNALEIVADCDAEIVADCDAEIAKWSAKRADALRAAAMCADGQKGGE